MENLESMREFIQTLPKAELHLHIEGTLEPELMFELAEKNKINLSPYQSPDDVRKAYEFDNLQSFLDLYYKGMSVLKTDHDFYELAMRYFKHAAEDGIIHAEIFFDPQVHTSRGIGFAEILEGLTSATQEAEKKWGITSGLILCFLRHLSEEEGFAILDEALPFQEHLIGFGLDSSESKNPPKKFKHLFEAVRKKGFHIVAHAGEEGPPEYIWQALKDLEVQRIDHGVRCLEDPRLVDYLINEQIPLTVCPLSNVKLKVVKQLADHPLKKMLAAGLNVSVHSDDPAYFGGYLAENLWQVSQALSLTRDDIKKLCENGLRASFRSFPPS